ncbi:MAG TPA: hypothetical protein VGL92_01040, partial [Acidimicrobiia bacterium]
QIVSIPFAIVSFVSEDSVIGFTVGALANILSDVITTPFVAAVFVLVYFDLRVRKEGFDLQLLAQAMGPLPEGGPPAPAGPYGAPPPAWPPPPSEWSPPGSPS